MKAAIQQLFAAMPKAKASLLDLNGVRAHITEFFDYSTLDLLSDVENGKFLWVFNIACDADARQELRFYRP
jgi:hypothetical protein